MRTVLFNAVTSDPALLALVPADGWLARGSVDTRPDTVPFVVMAVGETPRRMGATELVDITYWVHDERGSYVRIDGILSALEKFFENLGYQEGTDYEVSAVEWQGRSPDLDDDGFKTATRNVSFRVVGRKR
jgi:hypothetical protein